LAAVLPRMLGFQNEITVSVQNVMKKHGNYKYPGPAGGAELDSAFLCADLNRPATRGVIFGLCAGSHAAFRPTAWMSGRDRSMTAGSLARIHVGSGANKTPMAGLDLIKPDHDALRLTT
jgi:hypothetical protein